MSLCAPKYIITSPPEWVSRYCFHPVCLCVYVCVCLYVCVSVCPANILVCYFSAIRRGIDLKFIKDTYRVASFSSLPRCILKQGYYARKLQTTFRKFYGRHTDLVRKFDTSVSHVLKGLLTNCDV